MYQNKTGDMHGSDRLDKTSAKLQKIINSGAAINQNHDSEPERMEEEQTVKMSWEEHVTPRQDKDPRREESRKVRSKNKKIRRDCNKYWEFHLRCSWNADWDFEKERSRDWMDRTIEQGNETRMLWKRTIQMFPLNIQLMGEKKWTNSTLLKIFIPVLVWLNIWKPPDTRAFLWVKAFHLRREKVIFPTMWQSLNVKFIWNLKDQHRHSPPRGFWRMKL